MNSNIKIFIKNYIKEPILFPLKDIKKIFIGVFILLICCLCQIIAMLIAAGLFIIVDGFSQSIISFLTILPFSVLIYGYIGLVIKNTLDNKDHLPNWSNLKSIIVMGIKINVPIMLCIITSFMIFYLFFEGSIFNAFMSVYTFVCLIYYLFVIVFYTGIAIMNILLYMLCYYFKIINIIKILIYIIFLSFLPIFILNVIKNGIKSILNINNIIKLISIEYFGALCLIFLYYSVSNFPSFIYTYVEVCNLSFRFDLKYLIFEFIRQFLGFYFFVVIGRILGVYHKNRLQ